MMSDHLSQTQLEGYSGRTLNPHELLGVDRHLATCDVCHERLSGILSKVEKPAVGQSFESEGPFHLDYEQHLEPYVDGKGNTIDREIVESHVAECSNCATELSDLLAFKQQPASTVTPDPFKSRWKQWLPQLTSLSNPAFAAAVISGLAVLAIVVLFWITYPTLRSIEQAKPESSKQEVPSPATTEHAADKNEADNSTLPREEPLITLNDAGGQVIVSQRGDLEGLKDLPPELKDSVERALATGRLRTSPALTGWSTGAAFLRGESEKQSTFVPVDPTDVVIESDRPTFRWRALESASDYIVNIYDAKLRPVATSGPVTGTEWTVPSSLERGVTYSWQISAQVDGKKVVSPKPPLPEARFRILDRNAAGVLARLRQSATGTSHLAMGIFYWKHGLIKESERELQALSKANPNSATVTKLLASIRRR